MMKVVYIDIAILDGAGEEGMKQDENVPVGQLGGVEVEVADDGRR